MKARLLMIGLAAVLASGSTWAAPAEPTLKVGDKAPKLQTGKWVQGEPVKEFEAGKAYLVEFWATWCGPCRVSIPHLNEIHNKYKGKGLVVIGQDCWENDDKLVAPFVEKMGEKMTYRVALDDKESNKKGQMSETWMFAAGRNGIPSAFLVDTKGFIAWIGHPMQLKDELIDKVLSGDFDLKKAAADYDAEKKLEEKLSPVLVALNMAVRKKDWDVAEAKLAEAEELMPEAGRRNLALMKFNVLIGKKDYKAAYAFASRFSDEQPDNATMQNEIAWAMITDPTITERNLEVADKLATRANTAVKGKDAAILDTLARVKFMEGKKEEAIALQEKAVNLTDGPAREALEKTLQSYQRGELSQAR